MDRKDKAAELDILCKKNVNMGSEPHIGCPG